MIGIISPKIGLMMLKKVIEQSLQKSIIDYDIICDNVNNKVDIVVYSKDDKKKYNVPGDESIKLIDAIKLMTAKEVKTSINPEFIKICYRTNEQCNASIYYNENNLKTVKSILL